MPLTQDDLKAIAVAVLERLRRCPEIMNGFFRRCDPAFWVRASERPPLDSVWRPSARRTETVAVDASMSQVQPEGAVVGRSRRRELEDALFNAAREHVGSMIG